MMVKRPTAKVIPLRAAAPTTRKKTAGEILLERQRKKTEDRARAAALSTVPDPPKPEREVEPIAPVVDADAEGEPALLAAKQPKKAKPAKAKKPAKVKAPKKAKPAPKAKAKPAAKPVKQRGERKAKAPDLLTPKPPTKTDRLIHALRSKSGTTIAEAAGKLEWKDHTVRGAIFGGLKKKGLLVTTEVVEGRGRVYRLPAA
jgi:hypothetical protein